MSHADSAQIESLLQRWQGGDRETCSQLIELAYLDLRKQARKLFRSGLSDQTLQPTAIANEVCIRILNWDPSRFTDGAHFFASATIQMKNIYIDHLRRRPVEKRGGQRIPIEGLDLPYGPKIVDLLELDQAMSKLKRIHPRAHRIVELRFIAGLSEVETANATGVSVTTLKRDWKFAKGLLAEFLGGSVHQLDIGPQPPAKIQ